MLTLITKNDLLEAIAECQGMRSPNSNTAVKLAAFYTILDHLEQGSPRPIGTGDERSFAGYSLSPADNGFVSYDGTSDFAKAVNGRAQSDVWPVLDELMSTIRLMNERLYNGVMKKLAD